MLSEERGVGSRIGWGEEPVMWSQLETSIIGSLRTTLQSWPPVGVGEGQPHRRPSYEPLAAHTHKSLERGSEMAPAAPGADVLSLGHHYKKEIEALPRLEGARMEGGGRWGAVYRPGRGIALGEPDRKSVV